MAYAGVSTVYKVHFRLGFQYLLQRKSQLTCVASMMIWNIISTFKIFDAIFCIAKETIRFRTIEVIWGWSWARIYSTVNIPFPVTIIHDWIPILIFWTCSVVYAPIVAIVIILAIVWIRIMLYKIEKHFYYSRLI